MLHAELVARAGELGGGLEVKARAGARSGARNSAGWSQEQRGPARDPIALH